MKKTIAALILAAAAATPAFASDGSETVTHANGQPGYAAMSDGMGAYASMRGTEWQPAQTANLRQQELIQWSVNDR